MVYGCEAANRCWLMIINILGSRISRNSHDEAIHKFSHKERKGQSCFRFCPVTVRSFRPRSPKKGKHLSSTPVCLAISFVRSMTHPYVLVCSHVVVLQWLKYQVKYNVRWEDGWGGVGGRKLHHFEDLVVSGRRENWGVIKRRTCVTFLLLQTG